MSSGDILVIGSVAITGGLLYVYGLRPIRNRLEGGERAPSTTIATSEFARRDTEVRLSERSQFVNPLRDLPFQDFLSQVASSEHLLAPPQGSVASPTLRFLDVVLEGRQALDEITRISVEFTEKGRAALESGGRLMKSGEDALAVVVDRSGKIVEIGRVAGPSVGQMALSAYSVAVTLAWMLVASDIKKSLARFEMKLDLLLDLHVTAEVGEFEAAYESIRFITDPADPRSRAALQYAVLKAKEIRSRSRQRLALGSKSLTDPKWLEKLFHPKDWVEKDKAEVEAHAQHLSVMQLAVLMEAQALLIQGDEAACREFKRLMYEEADQLRLVNRGFQEVWNRQKKRAIESPALFSSIDMFAGNLRMDDRQLEKVLA